MPKRLIVMILVSSLLPFPALSSDQGSPKSNYAGQENRQIKSLSQADIEELEQGRGWGLAKAAELNGVPGPAHLLEMKTEIGLSGDQVGQIETIYEDMRRQAIPLGLELIGYERDLNSHFADGTITGELLQELLDNIARVHRQLRYVHLAAHLKTPDILTVEQIESYNRVRGYFANDPCKNIPAGHDPEMWKRHNNCP